MKYNLKKCKSDWVLTDSNGLSTSFETSQLATRHAYDHNLTEITIQYSPSILRVFAREALESFNLI